MVCVLFGQRSTLTLSQSAPPDRTIRVAATAAVSTMVPCGSFTAAPGTNVRPFVESMTWARASNEKSIVPPMVPEVSVPVDFW
jgi:hypothetical protein